MPVANRHGLADRKIAIHCDDFAATQHQVCRSFHRERAGKIHFRTAPAPDHSKQTAHHANAFANVFHAHFHRLKANLTLDAVNMTTHCLLRSPFFPAVALSQTLKLYL
jgi:hypothetical protein